MPVVKIIVTIENTPKKKKSTDTTLVVNMELLIPKKNEIAKCTHGI